MSKNYRLGLVLASTALVFLVADSRTGFAQRITFGGGNQSNRDRNKDKDKEEDDDDENRDNSRDNRSSKSGNRNQDQINQFLNRGQSGQNNRGNNTQNQGNPNQYRRSSRSGQFQENGQAEFQRYFRPKEDSHNVKIGGWQGDRWQGSRDVKNWSQVFAGGKQPFSSEWYHKHPKAWKYDNNKANIWVTASLPGVYSWLDWGNVPQQYNVGVGNTQHFDLSHYGEWYPLGVYSLMSGPDDMGTRIVQLAIDRHGHIAGNYYDLITDTNSSVSGDVKRLSQRVYWWLNKSDYIRFRVPLQRLVQPYGTMTVQLPGGEQDWQFVRLEN